MHKLIHPVAVVLMVLTITVSTDGAAGGGAAELGKHGTTSTTHNKLSEEQRRRAAERLTGADLIHASPLGRIPFPESQQSVHYRWLDDCCVAFTRAGGVDDSLARAQEQNFARQLRAERLNLSQIRFLFATDSPHVLASLRRADNTAFINSSHTRDRATLFSYLNSLPNNRGVRPNEIYLIAPHADGHITLPSGEQIPFQDLKVRAQENGILLNLWGCNSGYNLSHGILEEFNYGALSSALRNVLSKNIETHMQFLNELSAEMSVTFSFDIPQYTAEVQNTAEVRTLKTTLLAKDLAAGQSAGIEWENMFNHFELTGPTASADSRICNPLHRESAAGLDRDCP